MFILYTRIRWLLNKLFVETIHQAGSPSSRHDQCHLNAKHFEVGTYVIFMPPMATSRHILDPEIQNPINNLL